VRVEVYPVFRLIISFLFTFQVTFSKLISNRQKFLCTSKNEMLQNISRIHTTLACQPSKSIHGLFIRVELHARSLGRLVQSALSMSMPAVHTRGSSFTTFKYNQIHRLSKIHFRHGQGLIVYACLSCICGACEAALAV